MKYYISIILFSFVTINLWGQNQVCQDLGWNSNSQYPDVSIDVPNNIHNLVNYKIETTEINVRIAIEKDGVFPYGNGADFELNFNLTGTVKDAQGNTVLTAQGVAAIMNEPVTLSPDKSEAIFNIKVPSPTTTESSNPYNLSSNTIYAVQGLTIITSGTGVTSTTTAPIDLIDNIIVEVCHSMDLRVDVGETNNSSFTMINPELRSIPYHANGAPYYDFEWDALSTTPFSVNKYSPFYEFQLLKLENTELDPAVRDDEKHIKTIVDWSKALSFVVPEAKLTQGGFYKLRFRPSEGEGYYVWRVRPIGNYYEGGVAQNLNWGKWSVAGYPVSNGYTELRTTTSFDCFYYEDPNEKNNYLYSRTFTENGQVYESMTYADKLLRPRQTQSYLPSENPNDPGQTIVGQTLYDHLGRSSISVIPVPVDGYMNGYKDKFVENTSNELYSLEDYGTDGKLYNPEKVSTNGAYQYYSNDNLEDLTIPDAEGYPFTRTVYSNDGLNRVKEQSGIGQTHMVGTRADGRGRTTTTEIQVGVADAELVSIFGVEAPNPDHVVKQIVTDPNGTTSITYTSKSGKTLATALTESYDPDNDYPLTATDNQTVNSLALVESLNLGQYQNDRFTNSKTIILAQDAPSFLITYEAPGCGAPNTLPTCLQSAFSGCSYDVTVKVIKITSTGNVPAGNNPIYTSPKTTVSGCAPVTITTLNLPKGTYKVIKEVELGNDNVAALISDYQAEVSSQIAAYMELIGLLLDQVKNTSDWLKVDNAVDAVNIYLNSSRALGDQQTLKAALNAEFFHAFDAFIFSRLGPLSGSFGEVVIGMEYAANLDPNITGFPNENMDKIKLLLQDCEGIPTELSSEIKKGKNKLNLQQNSPYNYQPEGISISSVDYDYPPFIEYFLDEVGIDLYTSNPNGLTDFFKGYKYWDVDQNDWRQIDQSFVTKYINAVSFANSSQGNTDALKILNANQFNRMVWHMLNDEYYPDEVKYDATSGKYLFLEETSGNWKNFLDHQSDLNTTQYDVNDLTTCWKNLVSVFEPMITNSNVILSPNDFDEDINNGTPSGSQNYDGLKNNIPWIIKFLFGQKLDDAMDNTQANGGVQPFDNIPLTPTYLPQQFLECTGTKYARIILPTEESTARDNAGNNTGPQGSAASVNFNTYDIPLTGDQTTTTKSVSIGFNGYTKGGITIPGYIDEIAEYYGNYGGGKERVELPALHTNHSFPQLPFVQNPVFAFKYYEYWGRNSANSFPHPWDGETWVNEDVFPNVTCTLNIVNQAGYVGEDRPFSCILCEEAYAYNQVMGTCTPSTTGHDEWSYIRRSKFLACVRNISNADGLGFPKDAEIDCNDPIIRIDKNCSISPSEIEIEAKQMIADCESYCEDRREEFRKQVIEMFERACWQIGQCSIPGTTDFITTTDIEAVVDQLILECKGQCHISIPDIADFKSVSCVTNVGGVTIEYCSIPELDRCELLLRDIALHWKVELHIDPPSNITCDGNDPFPSNNDPICDPTTNEPNYFLNKTQEINVTVPSN